jgi:hypothetical protein
VSYSVVCVQSAVTIASIAIAQDTVTWSNHRLDDGDCCSCTLDFIDSRQSGVSCTGGYVSTAFSDGHQDIDTLRCQYADLAMGCFFDMAQFTHITQYRNTAALDSSQEFKGSTYRCGGCIVRVVDDLGLIDTRQYDKSYGWQAVCDGVAHRRPRHLCGQPNGDGRQQIAHLVHSRCSQMHMVVNTGCD